MKKKCRCTLFRVTNVKNLLLAFQMTLFLLLTGGHEARAAAEEPLINLSMKDVSVKDVIWAIEKQSKLVFVYNATDLDKAGKISVEIKNKTVREALDICLKDTGFEYVIQQNTIVIKRKGVKTDELPKITIRGKVVDKDSMPLPGVTILLKGTTMGVVSDKDGKYVIVIPKMDSPVLVFSFVGMQRQEIKYHGQPQVTIRLMEDVKDMEEVVVTGFQTIRKRDMVGSSNTVKREELFYNGTNSVEQMLQGKLPGMVVTTPSGLVGTRQKVRVRGTSTLLGNQEPVWVVDGIIQEDPLPFKTQDLTALGGQDNFDMVRNFVGNAISWLSPNDIADITVLKDASATVLYGINAANGVIVITTKRGSAGKMSVAYSGGISVSPRLTYDKMNLMNSKERIDLSREVYQRGLISNHALENVGYEGALKQYLNREISYDEFDRQVKYMESVNTDWFDILFRNAVSNNHSLSVSGGTDRLDYYASLNASFTNGTSKGNDERNYGAMVNVNAKLHEKVTFGVKLFANNKKTNGFYQVDPYGYATKTSRVIPCFDENGDQVFYNTTTGEGNAVRRMYNVLNELEQTGNKNTVQSYGVNLNFKYNFLKGLRYETTFGLTYSNTDGEAYASERSYYISKIRGYDFGTSKPKEEAYERSQLPHGGELNTSTSRNQSYTWRNMLSYSNVLGEVHRISAMVGMDVKSSKYDGVSSTVYGYFPDRGKTVNFPPLQITGSFTLNTKILNSLYDRFKTIVTDRETNNVSYYGSLTYSYDERYVLTASLRSDASNRFGQDTRNRFLPNWSVGLRWNVVNEPWMGEQGLISELNVKGSYGLRGNANEAFGPDLIAKIPSNNWNTTLGEYYLEIKSLPYADLRWEKTKDLSLGVDLGLFKNRITFTGEYYHKKTVDAIIMKEVAYAYGVTSMPVNGGDLINWGWELNVGITPIRTRDFNWNLSMNTSKNVNRVESKLEQNKNWKSAITGGLNKDGYPVSSIWAFEFNGLDGEGYPTFKFPEVALEDAKADATTYMRYAGKLDPDFSAGLSTAFRYKTLTLSAAFNMQFGAKRFLAPLFTTDIINDTPSAYNNFSKDLVRRWRKPGDENFTDVPSVAEYKKNPNGTGTLGFLLPDQKSTARVHEMYNYTDVRVVNASFFRCNNISLNYTFPVAWCEQMHVNNLSLTAGVTNPFRIVSKEYKGLDPEVATGSQPISRTFSLSLNISL